MAVAVFLGERAKHSVGVAALHEVCISTDSGAGVEPPLCCRREAFFPAVGRWLQALPVCLV